MSCDVVEHGTLDCSAWKNSDWYASWAARSRLKYSVSVWGKPSVLLMASRHDAHCGSAEQRTRPSHPDDAVVVDVVDDDVAVVTVTLAGEAKTTQTQVTTTNTWNIITCMANPCARGRGRVESVASTWRLHAKLGSGHWGVLRELWIMHLPCSPERESCMIQIDVHNSLALDTVGRSLDYRHTRGR